MTSNPKTAHNLAVASMVCGVVSAIIGGVTLDVIGLILGYLAYRSARKNGPHAQDPTAWLKTMALARNAMLLCLVLGVLNLVFLIMYMPYIDEIVNEMTSGQVSSGTASSSSGSLF
jgi:vacuolar-type H+-ATPase subunit I/STV1